MRKLKLVMYVCCAFMAMSVCSCTKDGGNSAQKVALFLPSDSMVSRWKTDADKLTAALKAYGYDVQLFTADEDENGAELQVRQIAEAVNNGYKNFVITPIDYTKINESGVLEANQDCNFICYDRMIMNNPAVDFYTTCNPSKIGEMQAQFLLEKVGKDVMNIEYFAGPGTDRNAAKFFEGAVNLLKDNAMLNVPSGKKNYEEVALPSWSSEDAKAAMLERIAKIGVLPDLILAPNDNIAEGIIKAIDQSYQGIVNYPVITGQDMTEEAVANIKAGKQAMTIYKDYENMAETAAMVVNNFISGKPVYTSDSFDNGKISVPTRYTSFTLITEHNID